MSTHFTIPLRRSPCGGGSYQAMPADLSAHLSLDEYAASLSRIQAANRSPLGARLLYALSWLGYMAGLLQGVGLFNGYESASAYGYDDYYVNSTWIGLGVAVTCFVALVALGRYMRKRRAAQVAAAVQAEHVTYSMRSPQLAWRVVDANHIEINVLDHSQHHIASLEHQVHVLQQQVAQQQHHQAVDHELIQHQAANARHAAAHYAPAPVAVAPVVQSPSHFHVQYYPTVAAAAPVAEPVYAQAVYQPAAGSVFAHPPPQYYAPRSDIRAPLVQHQHY